MSIALPIQGFRPFEPIATPHKGDLAETHPKGRVCALGACGCDAPAILSIYNPGETCSVCTAKIERIARRQ